MNVMSYKVSCNILLSKCSFKKRYLNTYLGTVNVNKGSKKDGFFIKY